ncbi:MAG: fumarylacetoacetate hydrolase family protein [Maricaulis sp.]|jgi:2-keto-4-pentenoate hydratase/2-oxohepta-3-ene-1,7-dioic acid hydratase in catechol pathway|nr:fumarylacetoacetate hydrolase family protein [Maricaulis sp.]
MKFVSFEKGGIASYGLVKGDRVVDLGARLGNDYPDLKSLIAAENWRAIVDGVPADDGIALEDVTLLSVIPNPGKILCVALNYHDHVAEANAHLPGGREVPKYPMMFARMAETVVGHNVNLVRPKVSVDFDYEAEMVAVIGKNVPRYTKPEDALAYVFGYAAMNEGSIRDYQFHTRQLTPGKNFYQTGATGPWLVTTDEIPDPQQLDVEFRLNGEILQKANTSDMIFSVSKLISYISEWLPLKPGDMIATGTMGGVGFTRKPPIFMKPGDRAEVSISKIGILSNGIVDEAQVNL